MNKEKEDWVAEIRAPMNELCYGGGWECFSCVWEGLPCGRSVDENGNVAAKENQCVTT